MPTAYHESQYHGPPSQPNRQVNKCKVVRKLSDNTWIEMYVPWDGHSLEQASYAIKNFAESLEKSSTQKPCRCHKQRSADPPQETCPQPQAFKRSSPEPQPFTRSPYQPKAPRNSLPQPQSFTGGPPQPNTARVSRELSPPQTQLRKGSPHQPDTDQYSTHQPQPLTGIPHQPQIDHYGPLELQAPNYTAPQYPLPPKTNPLPPARSKFTFTEENHQVICSICQAPAESSHLNYGAYSCFSCRAFFRRSVQMELYPKFSCQYERQCEITIGNRNFCRCCRFEKCQKMGMKISAVLSLEQKRTRFRKYLGLRRMDEMNKSAEMKVALRSFRKKPSAVHEKDALLNEDST
ncbi:hypothetical protein TCAL_09004 [Tigriopus californicus]|uniref:Nuclear receptor domain-containing protein n=2 Tax=Tigriopus californicus TaxID=6832 RepID=A0A553PU33_TIGCA|nr:hypothetical protein TCAL_09004 [Tigriopus californicus]|eukprot:TCALIF_09004-PA protein Name:"Similar to thrb-a Thyroid hormone receptor beta-A (Xenopus laevis)" AED:0.55 eAED:0.71 QI:0/-1/0/1/-1/1/1/0/347